LTKNPLYKNIYDRLKAEIGSGRIGSGEQLLSETKLAEEHSVSIITIRRAIHELVLDGLVESRHGIGSFVTDPGSSAVVVGMSSFTSDVASGRLRLTRTLLNDTMEMCPPDIAEKLRIPPNSIVRTLVRLDSEGSRPISIDEARIPPQLATHIDAEIAGSPLFMHLWQEVSGMDFERTEYDIWAEKTTPEDQRLLHIGSDTPVLCTAETAYDKWDTPCLHVITRYRGDRCRLSGNVLLVQSDTPKGRVGE
jgi:GntR family transcriptional regulator